MRTVARRLRVLSCGVAVIAINLVTQRDVRAAGEVGVRVESGGDRSECHRAGGVLFEFQRKDTKDYAFYCSTPDKDADCIKISPKKDSSGNAVSWEYNYRTGKCQRATSCFLTTACVDMAGLSDDCFELTALRRFRDDVLVHLPGGMKDVSLYYERAPGIVDTIARSERKFAELSYLYTRYVLPSAIASRLGLHRLTRSIYAGMMRDLAERYSVSLTNG